MGGEDGIVGSICLKAEEVERGHWVPLNFCNFSFFPCKFSLLQVVKAEVTAQGNWGTGCDFFAPFLPFLPFLSVRGNCSLSGLSEECFEKVRERTKYQNSKPKARNNQHHRHRQPLASRAAAAATTARRRRRRRHIPRSECSVVVRVRVAQLVVVVGRAGGRGGGHSIECSRLTLWSRC